MAKKFIPLEEAAEMLGLSPEDLTARRERHELSGYRDGKSWKFKEQEIDRLKAELAAEGSGDSAAGSADATGSLSDLDLDDDLGLDDLDLDLDVPDAEPAATADTAAPTSDEVIAEGDVLDLDLDQPAAEASGLDLDLGDLDLEIAETPEEGGSSAAGPGIGGSDVLSSDSGIGSALDDLDLDLEESGKSGLVIGDSGILPTTDDLSIDEGELALGSEEDEDAEGEAVAMEPGSSISGTGSSIVLTGDFDEGDLVVGESDSHGSDSHGSDVTLDSGSSGISLLDPSDSGLSLEDSPVDLGGSSGDLLDDLGKSDSAATDEGDDFLLAPLDDADAGDAVEESGSQVVALDEVGEADLSGVDFAEAESSDAAMLEEDLGGDMVEADLEPAGLAAAPAMVASRGGGMTYSGWNVASLSICTVLLLMSGMMVHGLLRNMWSWDGPHSVNSMLMDAIAGMF